MNGSILFNNSECLFNFDGKQLKIYANSGEAENLLSEAIEQGAKAHIKKSLPGERLEGYSYDDKKKIIFFIDKDEYGYSAQFFDYTKVVLKINVKRYILQLKENSEKDKSAVYFTSRQFGNLFGMIPLYTSNGVENGKVADINYRSEIDNQVAHFHYKSYECSAKPFLSYSCGIDLFKFNPSLQILVDGELNEDEIIKLINVWLRIFSFLYMRINIIPNAIRYIIDGYEYEFFIVKNSDYIEESNYKNDLYKPTCLTWYGIYEHFDSLFDDFANDIVHLNFLDDTLNNRKYISFSKVSKDGAFFENTFRLIYGDNVKHKTSTQKTNEEIIAVLEAAKGESNKKKNKTIDFLIKQLDHVTLSTKIQRALKDYKECCLSIRKHFNLENETNTIIADTCANSRNKIDHGDKEANIDSFVANCFVILRAVTYSMYLKRWGIPDETISNLVDNLYRL